MPLIIRFTLFLFLTIPATAQPFQALWLSTSPGPTTPNSWHCFRHSTTLTALPKRALARIAVDSKYWLWVNGKQVVYEGGLKRGPNPRDTYYDEVDLAPYLQPGRNSVAVLVWFWGGKGFSHNNSGQAGLIFDCETDSGPLFPKFGWKAQPHPAYEPSQLPKPNFRLSEPNIRFNAQHDVPGWQTATYDDNAWPRALIVGRAGTAPWGLLAPRPIPLFRNYGLKNYVRTVRKSGQAGKPDTLVATLPYDCHASPVLTVKAAAGQRITIGSDTYYMGAMGQDSLYTNGAEYITRAGLQTYESLGWLSGHEIRYALPKGVEVVNVQYRETGYNAAFAGSFRCNDPLLNRLWQKAQRTLYLNMRDNFMDCPDRERAQWAGDAALQMGQTFYALDSNATALGRKLYLNLADWQRPDSVIYNPVPESDWKNELPVHSLMPLFESWRYFRHTRDTATLRHIYPAMRRYLALWKPDSTGRLNYRKGGWDWGDWGTNQDMVLIQHGWYVLALQTAMHTADLLRQPTHRAEYQQKHDRIVTFLNSPACWNGQAYRDSASRQPTDDRANALMVLAGVADSAKYSALSRVFATQQYASPYMEKFVLESLIQMNRLPQAIARMKARYKAMTNSRLSTLWELWEYDDRPGVAHGNSGYNHGWSGGPLLLLSEYVAGLSPGERLGTYRIFPQLGGLTSVSASMPATSGLLAMQLNKTPAALTMTVTVPARVSATVGVPLSGLAGKRVLCNGKPLAETPAVRFVEKNSRYYIVEVPAGTYRFGVM
ncbi:family 78 glycoside hydrolase catalytic domain [Spirosoma montaniterrae]|uniref:Alpha-L-rhamnosidase six-hairpin glycosidase domain-containing protein n=1 Tax=Spirosoma montaniterrae TaxID=1178516 RepID=A0A1P9WX74_9BACT|nr:family 78 glycoside hydrolase catalytic domain [Spirosoma montaniterrae]AQG79928.1 hypothetical protein AWR27_11695 [Spirosoma montaniterrae]